MSSIINVISIIITFGIIVSVHEFGHFLFAKLIRDSQTLEMDR